MIGLKRKGGQLMARLGKVLKKIDIGDRIEEVRNYLANHPQVSAAFLFGSYGTEYQNNLSDLDIAVLLTPECPINFDVISGISVDLSELASEEDINVVILNAAPITLQFEILSTGRLLTKRGVFLEDFHEYVCKRYADFKIDLDAFNTDYDQALREVYLRGK